MKNHSVDRLKDNIKLILKEVRLGSSGKSGELFEVW